MRITNETVNVQSQEVINLRKKLVLSDDLIGASNEKVKSSYVNFYF